MSFRIFWKLFIPLAIILLAFVFGVLLLYRNDAPSNTIAVFTLVFVGGAFWCLWNIMCGIVKTANVLANTVDNMTAGDYVVPVYLSRHDEFGRLAASLNQLREQLVGRTAEMNRLSTVLAAMTDGVIAIDEKQCVQFANQSAGRMLGFSPDAAQGRPLLESVRSHKLHELVTRLLASKTHDELEMEWGDEDPSSLFINATFYNEEPKAGIIMMINNLSEIRHLQTMRRDFVANVSHELKTPLSSIKAYAETLRAGAVNDEQNRDRFIGIIEEQADRLNLLISDLLSLARIEQGRALMEIQVVPVQRVVQTCLKEQQRAANEKEIELICEAGGEHIMVNADPDGLRQILVNLIDNAIKYTPNKGRVTVGWGESRQQVQIFVADTGLGIPPEMQERVFERFFRVDKARSRELGGTGLGLAIVKHLAQSFGGTVEVASGPGQGSRFTVLLPRP